MELASKYNPADVEGKWYQYWLDHKLFSSKPDEREPYTVVIPPPNVTGVLHMGHMLNNTIQDILVRRARMMGKNACWVPGTDHASIATEAKVVNRLAQQGIKKTDLTREEFLKHAWAWTEEHGGIILKQLRKLGASCDWDRTAFTMDEARSKSVIKVFVDLYNKGLIYRGVRMVNWDPKALTALSDEEVIYKEEHSKLYYLRYYVADDDMSGETGAEGEIVHRDAQGRRYAVVATTRPETIMGDTAMCINPADPKNQWLKGKKVIVPLVGRVIPVIEDSYVDIEFGTGCLKVTPAHDVNDYMLGEKYNLPSIDIFNDNGTLSEAAGLYVGMDRFDVRAQIEKDLDAAGLLEKVEAYTNKVGFSERTNVAIEPKLSMQWFLKMQHFADMALPPVMNDELKFYPAKYKNTYRNWLENIKDWCISRQLWWGHRIPAYYLPKGGFVVAETPEQALELAKEKTGDANLKMEDLRQEDDCLDTWFSSWLWPISLFDGINNPGNEEIKYYYPTADLVTGPDIIFFWVARMIMAGYEYMGDMPFRNVYFTGIVRDKIGRKMSKSLGNSPDPLELIEQFGIPYHGISTGKLRRYFSVQNFTDPFRVIKGLGEAKKLVKILHPDVIFSKGGFVSVPVVLAGKSRHVPTIIHESDMTPGLANKISMPSASKICCNFPETIEHLPAGKAVLTGSPIRQELLSGDKYKALEFLHFTQDKPVIMVVGGSLGSVAVNDAVRSVLPELLQSFQVVHLCGKGCLLYTSPSPRD